MALSGITGGNLEISPFKLERLVELKMVQKINHHAHLSFTGVVNDDQKSQPIEDTSSDTRIELYQVDEAAQKTLLFRGVVSHVEIKAVQDVYYIEVEADSLTKLLDTELKSRSFQNANMTYPALITQVMNPYHGKVQDNASQSQKTGKFILQYQQTDWNFLVQLASNFNAGLIPDVVADAPGLAFGVPEASGEAAKLENCNYQVRKKLSDYRYSSENFISGLQEDDFVYYEVDSAQALAIGAEVNFNNLRLYVCEAHAFLEDGILKRRYIVAPKKGLSQNTRYNEAIVGLSLEGEVIAVNQDQVKVHLAIDAKQSVSEASWFPYSSVYTAEGNSGWYCMPEKGDHLRVVFSSHKAEEGIALSSVRQDATDSETNKVSDPSVKYFRTQSGKELMFSPSEIVITSKDNQIYLRLNDQDGIEIYSNKAVKIVAKNDLTMESENAKVLITAKEGIQIACDNSKLEMDKKSVSITGDEVKTN